VAAESGGLRQLQQLGAGGAAEAAQLQAAGELQQHSALDTHHVRARNGSYT
jgi:hypothetical protein